MLDLAQRPLLVAVADRPAAIINSAELQRSERPYDLVEARVDLFSQQSLDGCAHDCARLEATGTPVILTIRSAAQGGRFAGSAVAQAVLGPGQRRGGRDVQPVREGRRARQPGPGGARDR